jgi:hypothetical protein
MPDDNAPGPRVQLKETLLEHADVLTMVAEALRDAATDLDIDAKTLRRVLDTSSLNATSTALGLARLSGRLEGS